MLSKRIALRTRLPIEEAEKRLSAEILPKPSGFWSNLGFYDNKNKGFCGSLYNRRFSVTPILGYRNSMVPLICGELVEDDGGTLLRGTEALHRFVVTFMKIYNGFLIGLFLIILLGAIRGKAETWGLLLPPVMMLFAFGLVRFGFWHGCRSAEQSLRKLLEAEVCDPSEADE